MRQKIDDKTRAIMAATILAGMLSANKMDEDGYQPWPDAVKAVRMAALKTGALIEVLEESPVESIP